LDFAEPWPAESARDSLSAGANTWRDDDSSKLDGTAVFALDVGSEEESDGASASDAPPSPSPSPAPWFGNVDAVTQECDADGLASNTSATPE